MKNPLIPFRFTPAAWGLRGPAREEAEAAYLHTGAELERKLAAIRLRGFALEEELLRIELEYGHIDEYEHAVKHLEISGVATPRALLDIDFKFDKIGEYEYDIAVIDLEHPMNPADKHNPARASAILAADLKHARISAFDYDMAKLDIEMPLEDNGEASVARDIAELAIDLKHERITEHEFEKAKATLLEEPWIAVVKSGFDPDQGLQGVYFEFDWNSHWITYLQMNGYGGLTPEEVVDQWFSDVCRSQGMATMQNVMGTVVPFAGPR